MIIVNSILCFVLGLFVGPIVLEIHRMRRHRKMAKDVANFGKHLDHLYAMTKDTVHFTKPNGPQA